MLAALPAGAALRLPNLQDLQALLAIILALAQGIRRLLGLVPQILRQVRERARRRPAVVSAGTQAREARRREPGTSFQEDLFLTVDRVVHRIGVNLDLLQKNMRSSRQNMKIEIWKISRGIIHHLPSVDSLFAPSRMEAPPPTPRMDLDTEKTILLSLSSATWTRGRDVLVNVASNTISVFQPEDDYNLDDVPLYLHGVPIIPHPFPQITPSAGSDPFDSTEDDFDGLSLEQLKAFYDFFPGLKSIEFYYDRVVILRVARDAYDFCLEKVRGERVFAGFGCAIWLLAVYALPQRRAVQEVIDVEEASPAKETSTATFSPGCHIFNSLGAFSTLGMFLVKGWKYPSSAVNIDIFTVSAHSYLQKRDIDAGFNRASLVVFPLCMFVAYVQANSQSLAISWCRQYFINRMLIMLIDFLLLTWALDGKAVRISRGVSHLGLICIFLVPVLVADIVSQFVSGALSSLFATLRVFGTALISIFLPTGIGSWMAHQISQCDILHLTPPVNWISLVIEVWASTALIEFLDIFVKGTNRIEPSTMVREWMVFKLIGPTPALDEPVRIPYPWMIVLSLVVRWILHSLASNAVDYWTRYLAFGILCYDLIQYVWSFDIPSTFSLVGQPVIQNGKTVATVVESLDPRPSKDNPQQSLNDIAIAKLDIPFPVSYGHRPVNWDPPPNTQRKRVYLIGGRREGTLETLPQNFQQVQEVTAGIRGGLRYVMDSYSTGRSVDYKMKPAVIWRCRDGSIRGDSGGLLVCAGELLDQGRYLYHAVGFQSHEINSSYLYPRQAPNACWKIAYEAPDELREKYMAVAPMNTCMELDLKIARESVEKDH